MAKQSPCIDFLITQKCNYRCEYCSQSKKFAHKLEEADDKTLEAFLNLIKTLDKDFVITISGGEPLCHSRFFEVIKEIKALDLKLAVVSNFSFPLDSYKKIADIMGENLKDIFISFHPTQVKDFEEFKNKVREFNLYKNHNTTFAVGSVLSEENVETLEDLSKFLKENGVKFCPQHMRIKNSYVKYSKRAEEFLKNNAEIEPGRVAKTFGKLCHAGSKFLLIYQNGEAYRCYSSRFNKTHCLGNIKNKKFRMFSCAEPCMNFKCTCPKPISLNMLEFNRANYFKAGVNFIKNSIYLPSLILKNFDVVLEKLEQAKFLKKK